MAADDLVTQGASASAILNLVIPEYSDFSFRKVKTIYKVQIYVKLDYAPSYYEEVFAL